MRLIWILFIAVFLNASARADETTAKADWHQFRQMYPHHLQTVALSAVHADGHRTLIISEPPPGLETKDVEAVSRDFGQIFTGTHTIGVDGWVKDLVVDLPAVTDPALTNDVNRLHRLLFGTSYKAYALSIPPVTTGMVPRKLSGLDLHVGSADLASWLLPTRSGAALTSRVVAVPAKSKTTFSPLLGGGELTCDALLSASHGGVYLSHPAGLVIWLLSRSRSIDLLSVQIRQFSLDTDMIVGAISKGDQLAIIGRERTTDVSLLPPLRSETILQLAAASENELLQSYERTNLMAGKVIDEEGRAEDWAPILLSSRLVDTEYGSLLNITDQLLKGWSQHGEVKYVNFKYPEPQTYPFQQSLIEHLGVHEVTFNWNTKGAGYVSKSGPYEVYALNRTGALPIDYLAEGRSDVEKAEDDAYDWYAALNDPNLIRVVHYAALYQIFHHFGVHSTVQSPETTQPFASLESGAEVFLREVAEYSNDQLATFKKNLGTDDKGFVDGTLRPLRDALRLYVAGGKPVTIQQLAMASVSRSDEVKLFKSLNNRDADAVYLLLQKMCEVAQACLSRTTRSKVLAAYRKADTEHPGTWIRTPSVVESATKGGTGGHNLSAKVTVFEADDSVLRGKIKVREETSGQRVIRFNPRDDVRMNQVVRLAARDGRITDAELIRLVEQRMPTVRAANLTVREGLGHGVGTTPDVLRGFQAMHLDGGYSNYGWRPVKLTSSDFDTPVWKQLTQDDSQVVMKVSRSSDGHYSVSLNGGRSIEASDQPSAIDALAELADESGRKRVHLNMEGLDERQTRGFPYNAERSTRDHEIVATRSEDLTPEDLIAIKQGQYDLREAKLGRIEISEPNTAGYRTATQEVIIKSRLAAFKDLIVRIRISFKSFAGDVLAMTRDIPAQITKLLNSMSSQRDVNFATRSMIAELQKSGFYVEVRAEIAREGKNVFYVDNMGQPRVKSEDCLAG